MTSVLQVLKNGKRRIERGWTQYDFVQHKDSGPPAYCALGAIDYQKKWKDEEKTERIREAASFLKKAIPEAFGDSYSVASVMRYNDTRDRHKEEIIALYDRAIEQSKSVET